MPLTADTPRRTRRAALRAWRRAIAPAQAARAAQAAAQRAVRLVPVRAARCVAVYLADDGELDPAPLVRALWRAGKAVYLPYTRGAAQALEFRPYRPGIALAADALGILAPAHGPGVPAAALDVVILPLVGFDAHCRRLGRGGGHYDRSLARAPVWRVGYAYDGQRVAHIAPARWDVPLHAVVTPRRVWHHGRAYDVIPPVL